jgi:hypothetical protein
LNLRRNFAHSLLWKLCAAAVLLMLGLVLCGRISHPWTYNDDYNGAFWSQAARNLSRAGLLTTAGVPAPLYFGPLPIPAEALYVHHPTLLPDMMVLDRRVLGESEWAARCLPILFSVLTAGLLCVFVAYCAGWREATFVLAMYAAAPMELHYGQMVNFEAPELFFLLGGLCCFHLWQLQHTKRCAAGMLVCCVLAMWTDWQGYLLVILLVLELLRGAAEPRPRGKFEIRNSKFEKSELGRAGLFPKGKEFQDSHCNVRMAGGVLLAGLLSGVAFLLQIHLAEPGAWGELGNALRERSSHADLSGGQFTMEQWVRTELGYLTTLFNPAAWLLAGAGAALAFVDRRRLEPREAAPLRIGAAFFLIDAFYVCALRNQSYIHDFASFYFLIPVAVFSGYLFERVIRAVETRRPGYPAVAVALVCALSAGALIWWGIGSLTDIDTQFCILDDDSSEPGMLMPDVGRVIDQSFPADAAVICNFDKYYSPLPYYARREMVNDLHTFAEWKSAAAEAAPRPVGGIIWGAAADAGDLVRSLPAAETRRVMIDGIPFVLWRAARGHS